MSSPACSSVYKHHPGFKSVAGPCLIRGSVTAMHKMTQISRTTTDHPGYLVRGRPAPDPGKCDCGFSNLRHCIVSDTYQNIDNYICYTIIRSLWRVFSKCKRNVWLPNSGATLWLIGTTPVLVSLNRLSVGCGTTPRRQSGDSAGF